jgi:hypothetical protein
MTETEYLVESATVPTFSRKLRWPAYTNDFISFGVHSGLETLWLLQRRG